MRCGCGGCYVYVCPNFGINYFVKNCYCEQNKCLQMLPNPSRTVDNKVKLRDLPPHKNKLLKTHTKYDLLDPFLNHSNKNYGSCCLWFGLLYRPLFKKINYDTIILYTRIYCWIVCLFCSSVSVTAMFNVYFFAYFNAILFHCILY